MMQHLLYSPRNRILCGRRHCYKRLPVPDVSYNRPITAENVRAYLANVTISCASGVCCLPYISISPILPLAHRASRYHVLWHEGGHNAWERLTACELSSINMTNNSTILGSYAACRPSQYTEIRAQRPRFAPSCPPTLPLPMPDMMAIRATCMF